VDQDRDRWRAVVNMVMNLHKTTGSSWVAARLAGC
jgi:hypothetical protein